MVPMKGLGNWPGIPNTYKCEIIEVIMNTGEQDSTKEDKIGFLNSRQYL